MVRYKCLAGSAICSSGIRLYVPYPSTTGVSCVDGVEGSVKRTRQEVIRGANQTHQPPMAAYRASVARQTFKTPDGLGMTTRADRHDVDKLHRWRQDLLDSPSSPFPVYAVFLVSEADTAAHDIFRRFRSSFEEREAGFGNLVIFGQHGVSTTVHLLLEQLGLASDALPMLVLWDGQDSRKCPLRRCRRGIRSGMSRGQPSPANC